MSLQVTGRLLPVNGLEDNRLAHQALPETTPIHHIYTPHGEARRQERISSNFAIHLGGIRGK